jgi:hypothetical protein
MAGGTNADVNTGPALLVVVGVVAILGGIAMAKWRRAVAGFWQRTYDVLGMKESAETLLAEAAPGSRGIGLILTGGIFLIIWGLVVVLTGISRL